MALTSADKLVMRTTELTISPVVEDAVNPWKFLALSASVLLGGCANGFDRMKLQERLNDGSLQFSDAAIAEARAVKPQLRFPCRIAVHMKNDNTWRWTSDDKTALQMCGESLKKEGIVNDMFVLPDMIASPKLDGGDIKDLRLAAAKCGADVLLVVRGAAQTDSYKNPAAVFNLTIVGGYIVPASHRDSLFMMEGCLIDVDNGYIYSAVQAEGEGKIMRPTFLIEDKDAILQARNKAVGEFSKEFMTRLRSLKSNAQNLAPAAPPSGPVSPLIPTPTGQISPLVP